MKTPIWPAATAGKGRQMFIEICNVHLTNCFHKLSLRGITYWTVSTTHVQENTHTQTHIGLASSVCVANVTVNEGNSNIFFLIKFWFLLCLCFTWDVIESTTFVPRHTQTNERPKSWGKHSYGVVVLSTYAESKTKRAWDNPTQMYDNVNTTLKWDTSSEK